MKKLLFSLLTLISLLALSLRSVTAALPPPTITSVSPSVIVQNGATTPITITGTDFPSNAVVALDSLSLPTTYISPTQLIANVLSTVPPDVYDLTVFNPTDGTFDTAVDAVTVIAPAPTATPQPSATPADTATPAATTYARPLIVVVNYGASSAAIVPGSNPDFEMTIVNSGQIRATNVVATFVSGDFLPRTTGGIQALGTLDPGATKRFFQPLIANTSLVGDLAAILEVKISYTDPNGTAYSDSFSLTFPIYEPTAGPLRTSTPTPTPTAQNINRPQLLITAYRTDVEKLQPGGRFTLYLDVQNMGNNAARRITLIAGGGTASNPSGTPGPGGGVSGSGGDFTNFAPVNSSNIQSLGDLNPSTQVVPNQTFVVNASTNPGAYPVKFSFIYADDRGNSYTDDQVITLLVYRPPQVEVSFYRDPGPLFAGQPNMLPLQVVNLGRNTSVLGNMRVTLSTDPDAQMANNIALVGAVDPGGFFSQDASVVPMLPGSAEVQIVIEYTDDFNQPSAITKTLPIEVMESMPMEPTPEGGDNGGGFPPPVVEESLVDKILRFIKGLLGLDSGTPTQTPFPDGGGGGGDGEGRPIEEPIVVPLK